MNNYKRITNRTTDGKVCIPFNNEFYITQAYESLAELEDKLESGLLLDLPCKVGDTFWGINSMYPNSGPVKYIVKSLELHNDGIYFETSHGSFKYKVEGFLIKAEAEARLKELQGDKK